MEPCTHDVGQGVHLGGPPLTMTATAPCRTATGTRPAAGNTARVEPTARSRSHDAAASSARNRSSATRFWPKLMVADFRIPPQTTPPPSPSLDHRRTGRVGLAGPHPVVHRLGRLAVAAAQAHDLERRAVDLDDPMPGRCRPSGAARRCSASRAGPAARCAPARPGHGAPHWARPPTSMRSGGSATNAPATRGPTHRPAASPSSRPRGSWSRRPAGPRKSAMPESVEIPAPVSTTTRRACSSSARPRPIPSSSSGRPHGGAIVRAVRAYPAPVPGDAPTVELLHAADAEDRQRRTAGALLARGCTPRRPGRLRPGVVGRPHMCGAGRRPRRAHPGPAQRHPHPHRARRAGRRRPPGRQHLHDGRPGRARHRTALHRPSSRPIRSPAPCTTRPARPGGPRA